MRQRDSRYFRELGKKETETAVHMWIRTHISNPALPPSTDRGGHNVPLHISEHTCTHTHSCTRVSGHIHTDCPIAPLLLTTHTRIVLTCYVFNLPEKKQPFYRLFPYFSPFLPFPPGPPQQASLWQQCLTCLLSL